MYGQNNHKHLHPPYNNTQSYKGLPWANGGIQHYDNMASPTTQNMNMVNSYSKKAGLVPSPADLYIPETRMSEIWGPRAE